MNYIFQSNKYYTWYCNIITTANNQHRLRKDGVFENHHIIPKSCGGTNLKTNLVLLTPREHFVCHLLLVKIVQPTDKYKMCAALARFGKKISAREYHLLRSVLSSESTGDKNKSYGKKWMHDPISKQIYYLTLDEYQTTDISLIEGLPFQRGGHKNMVWITDGKNDMMVSRTYDLTMLPGWKFGRVTGGDIDHMKAMSKNRHTPTKDVAHSEMLKGRISIENSVGDIKRIPPTEFPIWEATGWKKAIVSTSISKSCVINDIEYMTMSQAARELNISCQTLVYRLNSKNERWNKWKYLSP